MSACGENFNSAPPNWTWCGIFPCRGFESLPPINYFPTGCVREPMFLQLPKMCTEGCLVHFQFIVRVWDGFVKPVLKSFWTSSRTFPNYQKWNYSWLQKLSKCNFWVQKLNIFEEFWSLCEKDFFPLIYVDKFHI